MKLLIVEDDLTTRTMLARHLEKDLGHEVIEANHALDAVQKLMPATGLDGTLHAIITDMRMKREQSGLWLLQYLERSRVRLPCLLRSSETTYRERGQNFNLKDVEEVFDFAQFRLKDGNFKDVDEFLKGLR